MLRRYSLLLLCFSCPALQAQAAFDAELENRPIGEIHIEGLNKSNPDIIRNELLIREHSPLNNMLLQQSLQRIKNLRIFHDVSATTRAGPQDTAIVSIHAKERWTTIPIFKLNDAGGSRYFVTGLYDVNSFGRFVELGAQYENLNGQHSGVVWFRKPQLLSGRTKLGADLWNVNRPFVLYEDDGSYNDKFILSRQKLNLFMEQELSSKTLWLQAVEWNRDSINRQSVTPMENSRTLFYRSSLQLGKLNHNNFLVHGELAEISLEKSLPGYGYDFLRGSLTLRLFRQLYPLSNSGFKFATSATDSNRTQQGFYLGGTENIRGFLDGQIRGRAFWQLNLEHRMPSIKRPHFILQHNVFMDFADAAKDPATLYTQGRAIYYSVGAGARFIFPKIYRLNVRVDYVIFAKPAATAALAFGLQQFF